MENGAALLPPGMIMMWSGQTSAVPAGWVLCDGTNGTPDLRNRFIVGAGGQYNTGNTGGLDTVTLTLNQIPGHGHGYNYKDTAQFCFNAAFQTGTCNTAPPLQTVSASTNIAGGGQAHENRPPYYALSYIMKT
jgi:microcystin-dependent protein